MASPNKIFPKEIVEYSVEKYFSDYDTRTNKLYIIVLSLVIVAFLLMFIIKVNVSVRSAGLIRPLRDRTELRSAIDGVVDTVCVNENDYVKEGAPILVVHSKALEEGTRGISATTDRQELENQVTDLRNLIAGKDDSLVSNYYKQQYRLYKQRIAGVKISAGLANKNFSRYNQLYKRKVIAPAEYDKYNYERQLAQSDIATIKEQQLAQWQADYNRLSLQSNTMVYTVKAPTAGYVQQLKGLRKGSYVSPNDIIGEVSPDSGMIAEIFVLPKDIGMIKPGTEVRMQVDAFDYNEWGMLHGHVESISDDILTEESQPYFKVRCRLDKQTLQLKNGYKGYLKKGMSLQARFVIARRSLFQLLRDQTDDWLDPNQVKNTTATTAKK